LICAGGTTVLDAGCKTCKHLWSTGDTTQKITVAKKGSYKVTGIDPEAGCTMTDSVFVDMPTPDISKYSSGCQDEVIVFNCGYLASTYSWDIGDGLIVNGLATVTHAYSKAGDYTIKLMITKGSCTTSLSQKLHIYPKITADFTTSGRCVMDAIRFSANTSSDTSGATFIWKFGDGKTDSGMSVSHIYSVSDSYYTTLAVTNKNGCKATASKSVIVYNPPDADFTISDSVLTALNGTSYSWFLSGNTIPGANAKVYTAKVSGMYSVSVGNDKGCRDTSAEKYVNVLGSGINQVTPSVLSIHPNPGTGLFLIDGLRSVPTAIFVTDVFGRTLLNMLMHSQRQGSISLDLSSQPSGYYTLQVVYPDRILYTRIIKM
jgi:PKD repeat protein